MALSYSREHLSTLHPSQRTEKESNASEQFNPLHHKPINSFQMGTELWGFQI
jgi:hypothetical protein